MEFASVSEVRQESFCTSGGERDVTRIARLGGNMTRSTSGMRSFLFSVLCGIAVSAQATLVQDSRTSNYGLTGLSGNFSGAVADYGITVSGNGVVGDVITGQFFNTKSNPTGLFI